MSKNHRRFILDEFHENCEFKNLLKEVDTLVGEKDDLKGSSIKTELIQEHMKKKDIVLLDKENEFKSITGTGKPFVKKLDIDLNNGKVTTFNPFDNEGYAVTCSKCKSTNVKYDHNNTKFNHQNKKVSIQVKCLDCENETTEER